MNQLFLSLALIFCGGSLPLFLWRRFALMKQAGVAFMSFGCMLGFFDAVFRLFEPANSAATAVYRLNAFPLFFKIDSLSAFFLLAIFSISLLAVVYSYHYMHDEKQARRTSANYFFFGLLIGSMALVVSAGNLVAFMLAWEIMSLSSFFLVVYNYEDEGNRRAGYLYFVFSQAGAMFLFAAFGLMYAQTGDLGFDSAATLPETAKMLVFILAFVGFGSKAGVFPLHVWLPHAHPAAPSHISAVMSGVMIKTGVYGILRMYAILDWQTPVFGFIVLTAGMVSGVLGVVYALGQHDLKRLLAYHSVENIGIILIGVGVGMIGAAEGKPVMAILGFSGGLLHVLNHSLFKSLLFMGAGMVLHRTGTRTMDALGGLIKKMKITGTTFLIGSLAISGLPPFNCFVSEFLIYIGGFRGVALSDAAFAMNLLAIVSLAVIGGLALACFTKVVGVVFQGEPRTRAAENAKEEGVAMLIPMAVLAAVCVLIGVFPSAFVSMAVKATFSLQPAYGNVPLEPFMELTGNVTRAALVFFLILAVIVALRTRLYKGKTVTVSGTWGCGFTRPTVKMQYTSSSYAGSILQFFGALAPVTEDHPPVKGRFPAKTHYHSHVHDIAEMHMENAVVRPVLWMFDKLRWLQHGDIHLYIGYILLAIVVLLFFV